MDASTHNDPLVVTRGPDCLIVRVQEQAAENSKVEKLADRLLSALELHSTKRVVVEIVEIGEGTDAILDELRCVRDSIASRGGSLKVVGEPRKSSAGTQSLPFYPDLRTALLPPRSAAVTL